MVEDGALRSPEFSLLIRVASLVVELHVSRLDVCVTDRTLAAAGAAVPDHQPEASFLVTQTGAFVFIHVTASAWSNLVTDHVCPLGKGG